MEYVPYHPASDYSGDGISNQIAYVMGLDPRARYQMSDLMPVVFEQDRVVVHYPRSWYVYDIETGIEWSSDLKTWSTDGVVETRVEDTIDPLDPGENVTWRHTWQNRPEVERGAWTIRAEIPRTANESVFIRLKTAQKDR